LAEPHDIDWPALLGERLITAHPDMLGELPATFIPRGAFLLPVSRATLTPC